MQTFAERLISLREDKGWKKKELAEKLHVSDSMISQYESGRCMPSYDVIITIARLFHVSVDYLLCGSAEAFPSSDVFVAQISQAEFLEKNTARLGSLPPCSLATENSSRARFWIIRLATKFLVASSSGRIRKMAHFSRTNCSASMPPSKHNTCSSSVSRNAFSLDSTVDMIEFIA